MLESHLTVLRRVSAEHGRLTKRRAEEVLAVREALAELDRVQRASTPELEELRQRANERDEAVAAARKATDLSEKLLGDLNAAQAEIARLKAEVARLKVEAKPTEPARPPLVAQRPPIGGREQQIRNIRELWRPREGQSMIDNLWRIWFLEAVSDGLKEKISADQGLYSLIREDAEEAASILAEDFSREAEVREIWRETITDRLRHLL